MVGSATEVPAATAFCSKATVSSSTHRSRREAFFVLKLYENQVSKPVGCRENEDDGSDPKPHPSSLAKGESSRSIISLEQEGPGINDLEQEEEIEGQADEVEIIEVTSEPEPIRVENGDSSDEEGGSTREESEDKTLVDVFFNIETD